MLEIDKFLPQLYYLLSVVDCIAVEVFHNIAVELVDDCAVESVLLIRLNHHKSVKFEHNNDHHSQLRVLLDHSGYNDFPNLY